MLQRSKVLAGVLVAVFAAATLPVAGWANSSGHVEPAAGCHRQKPATPTPAQPSHQCCATGHQWAFPGSPLILHPVVAQVGVNQETHNLRSLLSHDRLMAFLSDSPPVNTLLRI
jgi:hypothetical protein